MAVDITKVLIDGTFEGRTNPAGLYRLCDVFEVNANVDDPCGCTYTICLNDEGATNGQVLTRLGENTFGWTTISGGTPFECSMLAGCSFTSFGDVSFTNLQPGDIMKWNGTDWINTPIPTPTGITDFTLTPGANVTLNGGNTPITVGDGDNITIVSTASSAISVEGFAFVEDFLGTFINMPLTTIWVGNFAWSGIASVPTTISGHPGIVNMSTLSTQNSFIFSDVSSFKCIFYIDNTSFTGAASRVNVGFGSSNGVTSGDNEAICFSLTQGETNWKAVNNTGGFGTSTVTDTLVTSTTGWVNFEIVRSGTYVVFKINGSIVATHSTNIPSGALPIKFYDNSVENVLNVDYVEVKSSLLSR